MIYGSVCSGIEAASVAWHPLGWRASFLSEIEPFPRSVLAHHYSDTPLHGDFTTIQDGMYEPIDLLVGGTPCQSFSVAGLRAGLDDPRGNLMLEFGALAKRLRPTWLVWENVPGVLSSNGGRDFGSFLAMLGQLGYGFAYRVLDAQYFGVAQRRRRVFVVGYLGDWRRAAAVLFESESLRGNPAPSREAGKEVAENPRESIAIGNVQDGSVCTISSREHKGLSCGRDGMTSGAVVTYGIPGNWIGRQPENGGNATEPPKQIAPCLTKTDQHGVAYPINTMTCQGRPSDDIAPRMGIGIGENGDPCPTLTKAHSHAVAYAFGVGEKPDVAHCLRSGASKADKHESTTYVAQQMAVRRLTPTECERLQGFPDGYTQTPHNGKPASDGPRYKALGNSMAVPVMRWIGKRIEMVNAL